MSISAASRVSSLQSSPSSAGIEPAVKIIVDRDHASHIDDTGNCYVNPGDCAVQYSPGSDAYIFDIEFLQQLRRHIRKAGRFELDIAPLARDLQSVASSLRTILEKNLTPGQ